MGIKTHKSSSANYVLPLKNLPTTWGLRHRTKRNVVEWIALKNLPTTWGLRRQHRQLLALLHASEKPPHHMGIKTYRHV